MVMVVGSTVEPVRNGREVLVHMYKEEEISLSSGTRTQWKPWSAGGEAGTQPLQGRLQLLPFFIQPLLALQQLSHARS